VSVALTIAAPLALSQTYPNKPVRVIVWVRNGRHGRYCRAYRRGKVERDFGPPASWSTIGQGQAAAYRQISRQKASPDGYTLLICGIGTHAVIPAIYRKLPYDPVRELRAHLQIGTTPNVLIVHPSVQAKSVSEFHRLRQGESRKISIASSGCRRFATFVAGVCSSR